MSARIYIEGGGDSKELHARCRAGFRQLLESCGYKGRMPRLIACGGRNATFDDFSIANRNGSAGDYIGMLLDSEDPVADGNRPWDHLSARDGWNRPPGAAEEQVLLMTTCMETWVVADRPILREYYGAALRDSALPSLTRIEERRRFEIQEALWTATSACPNRYEKGKRSFDVLARLTPSELRKHLSSFVRLEKVLNSRL